MQTSEPLLRSVQRATRKLAKNGDLDAILRDVLLICVEAVGAEGGTIYLHDPASHSLVFRHVLPEQSESIRDRHIQDDEGMAGKAFQNRTTLVSETDFSHLSQAQRDIQAKTGIVVSNMITVPLMMEDTEPIGVVQLINKPGSFNEADVAVLDTVSAVAAMAFENARLLDHEKKTTSLIEMGKVGHDIGNLAASLYANVSFIDMDLATLREEAAKVQCVGAEPSIDSLEEMSVQLRRSVDRIVSYSRLLSDFSKGKALRPSLQVGQASEIITHAAAFSESEARKSRVKIVYDVQADAAPMQYDEMFLHRIVQNLTGNAVKAVRESLDETAIEQADEDEVLGNVAVRYRFTGSDHVLEVKDTGPGMSEDTKERILAGLATSRWDKASGSGWGMKIVLELAAAMNGKVEIDTALGRGSTFRVRFPVGQGTGGGA
ncbi:MAG: ATP-binding protein [Fimbriimonadales bacterium]